MSRKRAAVTCGHDGKHHVAHGLCVSCYPKYLRANKPKYSKPARKDGELRRRYGITLAEKTRMLDEQGGKCAICDKPIRDDIGRGMSSAHVDHCHSTGAVRGLLCFPCNRALGSLGDCEAGLERALAYLRGELRRAA